MSERIITTTEFKERLAAICLSGGAAAFPRRYRDRQILYRSIVQRLERHRKYSEEELNTAIQQWLLEIGGCLDIDHVTLRRYLIDERYLTREMNGSAYEVRPAGNAVMEFEPEVSAIDAFTVIQDAKDRIAERRKLHSSASR